MQLDLHGLADEVFCMDRELPEMVFRQSDLCFFATEALCPFMEPVTSLVWDITRALEPPEHRELYWVDRHGEAGALGGVREGDSLYPEWRKVLDEHHGLIFKLVMFSPSRAWGLWVDVKGEMAVLGVPPDLDAALSERVEQEFCVSIEEFVDDRMRPLGPLNSRW